MFCIICPDGFHVERNLDTIKTLIAAGIDVNRGGDALCKAIICCSHSVVGDIAVEHYRVRVKPMVQLLLDNGANLQGPLDSLPSVICSHPKLGKTHLVMSLMRAFDPNLHTNPQKLLGYVRDFP